jgi:solute carrier family 12 sodium/potassium/chloride transporter 2
MAKLLSKLRIDYSSLTMLQGVTDKPHESTIDMHNKLINGFLEGHATNYFISETELSSLREKTNRQLRLRELLLEHSNTASLIVMSLPLPRKGTISAPLYMSWLEMLTKDMPPFLLIRGNQSSVLTFYS